MQSAHGTPNAQSLDPIVMFTRSLKSPYTQKTYLVQIEKFMAYLGAEKMADIPRENAEQLVISYLLKMADGGLSYASRQTAYAAIKHYYSINDTLLMDKEKEEGDVKRNFQLLSPLRLAHLVP